jgi:hypothetical protein
MNGCGEVPGVVDDPAEHMARGTVPQRPRPVRLDDVRRGAVVHLQGVRRGRTNDVPAVASRSRRHEDRRNPDSRSGKSPTSLRPPGTVAPLVAYTRWTEETGARAFISRSTLPDR